MHILILGSGGREHSIAWAVKQNPKCTKLTCAPGNAGMQQIGSCINLDINDGNKIKTWSEKNNVDLVIIGPEEPLSHGVSDILNLAGILTFAPSMEASKLESSKHFTKQICNISGAPTAKFKHFKDQEAALKFLNDSEFPLVIKADGLAAGKGVIIASTHAEAITAINDMFGGQYGDAGAEVIIEEIFSLEQLQKFPGVAIPKALWDTSFIGIISLEELADAFPEAARAAIAADRSGLAYDGTSESLLGFLKSQLRARSVAPIEGADADAVLSRVEAALKNSHLELAISELAKLDPPAADLMANWKASALQRIEIIKALDGIAAKVEE